MHIEENYSLKKLNSFGIDVFAKSFVLIQEQSCIQSYLSTHSFNKKKSLILGGGSNILFTKNYDGTIFHSNIKGIKEIKKDSSNVYLDIGSGENWDDLVNYCVEREYGGIENLSLIPGTVGAAPIQNIGAYGVEFEDVFISLDGIDLSTGEVKTFGKSECEFGYRNSIFKKEYKNNFFITRVRIKLDLIPSLKINYRAIKDFIKERGISDLNIKSMSKIVREIRESKLPDPNLIGNAGSFFKNPVIEKDLYIQIKKEFKDLVAYEISENEIKVPAGWLIEKSGFKGRRFGEVGVHENQALVLVNFGNGKGNEIVELSEKIKTEIFDKFNIVLEPEVNIV